MLCGQHMALPDFVRLPVPSGAAYSSGMSVPFHASFNLDLLPVVVHDSVDASTWPVAAAAWHGGACNDPGRGELV